MRYAFTAAVTIEVDAASLADADDQAERLVERLRERLPQWLDTRTGSRSVTNVELTLEPEPTE